MKLEQTGRAEAGAEKERLPAVSIERVQPKREARGTMRTDEILIKKSDGQTIGKAMLNVMRNPKTGESTAYLNTISIDENVRGQGFGKAAYIELIHYLKERGSSLPPASC